MDDASRCRQISYEASNLGGSTTTTITLNQLPFEIIVHIIRLCAATSDDVFLNPAFDWGFAPPWRKVTRTGGSLSRVSKGWRSLVLPILYSNIVLDSFTQLGSLLTTFNSQPSFCGLVRRLDLYLYIPVFTAHITRQHLTKVVALCSSLRSMSCWFSGDGKLIRNLHEWEAWLETATPRLSDLRINVIHRDFFRTSIRFICRVIHPTSMHNLVSLTLPFLSIISPAQEPLICPSLVKFQAMVGPRAQASFVDFCRRSSFPGLRSLVVCLVSSWGGTKFDFDDYFVMMDKVLQSLGPQLSYLHLLQYDGKVRLDDDLFDREWGWADQDTKGYQGLLDLCPNLEHFVAPIAATDDHEAFINIKSHKSLRWIDAWVPSFDIDTIPSSMPGLIPDDLRMRSFPSLQGCRRLDISLLLFPDLPLIFPPHESLAQCTSTVADVPRYWTIADSVRVVEWRQHLAPPVGRVASRYLDGGDSFVEPADDCSEDSEWETCGLSDSDCSAFSYRPSRESGSEYGSSEWWSDGGDMEEEMAPYPPYNASFFDVL
ncbi:uncharacterized protein STEHIDRAFT_114578 [Stereum hirsutum FP-91666 SS1]|uniref:uncharacterized protein n=1 Tax=Stereum hirsutum (strain FP-91666) TaxID=721885 RepID=UPI000444A914|nr:uncharacterized protein STEHIDRAFT_114578 [Stereum hirsutum FP-91666 SS1]EIM82195.1 hypothetical protein STEHIDRAFT_114578 [Stereum hirsutum FP-91666 SS1]